MGFLFSFLGLFSPICFPYCGEHQMMLGHIEYHRKKFDLEDVRIQNNLNNGGNLSIIWNYNPEIIRYTVRIENQYQNKKITRFYDECYGNCLQSAENSINKINSKFKKYKQNEKYIMEYIYISPKENMDIYEIDPKFFGKNTIFVGATLTNNHGEKSTFHSYALILQVRKNKSRNSNFKIDIRIDRKEFYHSYDMD